MKKKLIAMMLVSAFSILGITQAYANMGPHNQLECPENIGTTSIRI